MKKKVILLLTIICFVSCKEPEPRHPVSSRSGTFFKESVERNKQLLAFEENLIKKYMDAHPEHTYHNSSNGYWYYYNSQVTEATHTPVENDIVKITYDIRTFNQDTLYTHQEIGEIVFKIDKEALFPGLRTGVKLMKEGETVTFLLPSAMGYGYHGDENKIGTNFPLISTVTLHEIIDRYKDSIN
ncbi:gliding motility-associated peptidyl-prolyl isomerase GldI [Ascidiimonas aurantiaca]|uniref:gliding motility-associated peptidyl-prolyl isomerase GldI n=1 Tax=Ascidiimonas aurantiaca TaxID=1685432 RepID=UPI0030EEAF95